MTDPAITTQYIKRLESQLHQEKEISHALRNIQSRLQDDIRKLQDELTKMVTEAERGRYYREVLQQISTDKTKSGKLAKDVITND